MKKHIPDIVWGFFVLFFMLTVFTFLVKWIYLTEDLRCKNRYGNEWYHDNGYCENVHGDIKGE